MTNTETLYCEVCKDYFERPLSRGRKPRFCPEHVPVKPAPEPVRTLYCQAGEHEWQWETKRGRTPTSCPDHRVIIEGRKRASTDSQQDDTPIKMRTLYCRNGDHEWEAPKIPGRVPAHCPEHRNAPVVVHTPRMAEFREWLTRERTMYERYQNAPTSEHRADWHEVLKACPIRFATSRY